VIFSSNIIKTPESSTDGAKKKRREKERKRKKRGRERKAPIVTLNKGEVNILRRETLSLKKNLFRYDFIFTPSIPLWPW
jgi:hypothetical protein